MRIVFDIEANGLLNQATESENATKIHCMCYYDIDTGKSESFYNESDIVDFFMNSGDNLTLVGHKIITYDIPLLEKLLGLDLSKDRKIDTLGLSWYLYPNRIKHGLEEWGEDLGIAKPPIDNWQGDTQEERDKILHRCEQDVKINTKLWELQLEYLKKIYNNDMVAIDRFINYISFKLDCAREQEQVKLRLDVEKAKENLAILDTEKQRKIEILADIMPPSHTYKIHSRPKIPFKKDGTTSSHGQKWFALLEQHGLPEHHLGALKVIDKTNKGNPGSHQQLKDWLFTLGWKPTTFKYVKEPAKIEEGKESSYTAMNKDTTRAIPQLSADDGSGICPSVKELYDVHPELVELEDLFVINHRISILKGFLEKVDANGLLKAEIAGLTNTLRFQHAKPIVNLPAIPKKYWEMIRGCLIAPDENHLLCGSDMSGLEANTRDHYMYFFDAKYVQEMRVEGFDSHLDIATLSKAMTVEEAEWYKKYNEIKEPSKEQKELYSKLKAIRLKSKKVNFSCVYGAGIPKVALTANISLEEARKLHTTYWIRNKAVKLVANNTIVKTIDGQMWLYNPVSRFWYTLRFEKDKFSTLNQSTAVYCFDTWVRHVRSKNIQIAMQYHDEICFPLHKDDKDIVRQKLDIAIKQVNEEIRLNVPLGISADFGQKYSDIH